LFTVVAGIYFAAANRNIVTRNAMLAALSEAKSKTERAAHFKGDLLNHLGHAMREPLSNITSQSDLLLYRATDALSHKDQQIVGDIRKTARELLAVATNFLHIARLQSGKPLNLEEDDCDLDEIVQPALSSFADRASQAGVTLRSTQDFTRALVRCDKLKLKQIFTSLIDNAVKHTPSGGAVEVAVRAASSGEIVIAVRDTGPGIPTEHLKQLMVPFTEMDNMFDREAQASGLGLSLALGFAQAHGGALTLNSSADGTVAEVTLPAYRVIKIFNADQAPRRASEREVLSA
jgi:signal transduction histidine kinase